MTDKELKKIREAISCPQLGDDHYGEWGILNINQRRTIKRMLDFIDGQENYIKSQQAEIERLTTLSELGKMRASDYRVMRDRALKAEKELERLKAGVNVELENYASEYDSKIKAEAIKEFAERLKEYINGIIERHEMPMFPFTVAFVSGVETKIDNLVKEMVGEQGCD